MHALMMRACVVHTLWAGCWAQAFTPSIALRARLQVVHKIYEPSEMQPLIDAVTAEKEKNAAATS